MKLRMPKVRAGINPGRYVGAWYAIAPYSHERRPLITLNLIWVKVWIYPPWEHFHAMAFRRYGWSRRLGSADPARVLSAALRAHGLIKRR